MNKLTTCVRSLCISRTLFADSSNYSFRLLRHVIVLLIVPATLFAKIPIIIDSDANNEVDDQQAIGYTLFNSDIFDVRGITTNRTYNGGAVANHTAEALRIIKLCGAEGKIPLIEGADGDYNTIKGAIHDASYDGKAAVDFIIQEAHKNHSQKLILAPIGKLTNIALAFDKDPTIIPKVTVVWLGSNWPDAGEYNLENDIPSVNAVFETEVELWIPTVNYNKDFGTAAVVAYTSDINSFMPGKGPTYSPGITGRNGGTFHTFGDYSVNLFNNTGDSYRAMYDMAAVAIIKNPSWGVPTSVGAPYLNSNGSWTANNSNSRKVIFYQHFNKAAIMDDFYESVEHYTLEYERFIASFSSTLSQLQVTVDASTTEPIAGESITSYAWDFGDGATGTGVTASHTYSSFGENTVTLIVTQSDGAFDTLTQNITLHDGNPDNTPDADINLALLPSSKISGSGYSRGDAGDILFDPQTNTYAQPTGWNEYGIGFGENLGLASEDTPFYWQVSWNTPQYINYITFGGTYPNQPQPNAVWKIQYSLHDSWTDIETGTGGWINSGIYEWGGSEQPPITADSMRVIVYSDGVHDLTSIHLRGRGAQSTEEDDSHTTPKATLIQYVPLTIDLPSSNEHTSSSSEAQVLSNSSTDTYSESASNTSSPISMSSFISSLHSSMYGETSELTSSDASIAPVADNSTSRHLTHLGGNLFTLHSADIKNYSLKLYDIAGNTIPFAFVYSTTIQVKIQHTGVMLYRLDSRNSKQRGMVYVY